MSENDVCVVTHPLGSAGENATRTLLEILTAITSVSLITANLPKDSSIREGFDIVEVTSKDAGQSNPLIGAWRFLRNQFRMSQEIARRNEEIFLFFGATSYVLPILAARITGKTVVLEPRGNVPLTLHLTWRKSMPDQLARLLSGIVEMLERVCYYLADAIITYTPSMAAELGLDRFDDKLYPHGARYVNIERFSVKSPFEERGDVVGFVGRIDEEKGIRSLAEVAERLSNSITFRFVGDGPLYNWLNSELEGEIQLGRVEMTGWVDHEEIPNQLNDLKLLIMASQPTEGLPTIILESMACGVPVVAPGVSGIPDVVRHGETGIIVNNVDPISMVSLIESHLNTENELSDMSVNARELIEEGYSFSAAKKRYSSIITSLKS